MLNYQLMKYKVMKQDLNNILSVLIQCILVLARLTIVSVLYFPGIEAPFDFKVICHWLHGQGHQQWLLRY